MLQVASVPFPLQDGTLLYPVSDTILGSIPAVHIICQVVQIGLFPASSTALPATLYLEVCGIMNNGTVIYQTESGQVTKGQLGFSVKITNWPWTIFGQYLELKVRVSVMAGCRMSVKRSAGSTTPFTMGLGTTDSYAMLSTKVQVRIDIWAIHNCMIEVLFVNHLFALICL